MCALLFGVGVNVVAGVVIGLLVIVVLTLLAIMAGRSLFAKDTYWETKQAKLGKAAIALDKAGFPKGAEIATKLSQKDISGAIEAVILLAEILCDPVHAAAFLDDTFFKQLDLRLADEEQRDKVRAKLDEFEAQVRAGYERRMEALKKEAAKATSTT